MAKKFPIYATAICQGCKQPKPIASFKKNHHKDKRSKDKRDPLCKDCRKQAIRQQIRERYPH